MAFADKRAAEDDLMQAATKTHRKRRHHRGSRYRRRIRGFSLAVYTLGALATIVICKTLWVMFGG